MHNEIHYQTEADDDSSWRVHVRIVIAASPIWHDVRSAKVDSFARPRQGQSGTTCVLQRLTLLHYSVAYHLAL
jgi:hypothetical protein